MSLPSRGRERLWEVVSNAVDDWRWVSLVGPPGSGKTHLARSLSDAGGVWVDVRGLDDPVAVLGACVRALGADPPPDTSPEVAVHHALEQRARDGAPPLLVVDGNGPDLEALGASLAAVLETTPAARFLVTSHSPAGHPAERVVRVPPLSLPAAGAPLGSPAFAMLTDRIAASGGHPLDLTRDEPHVRRLLEATGGLPLLIEQIAVQVALLGVVNVTPSASLSAAFGASYALLDDDARRAFRRLATMPSAVPIQVLAAITGVEGSRAIDLAAVLTRRSLVEVRADGRLDMLSPLRRHGRLLASVTDDAEVAAAALVEWADRTAPQDDNVGAADVPWLVDLPLMRAAIARACAYPATRDHGYRLANRLFSSLYTAMRADDVVVVLSTALESGDGPGDVGAQVARRAGIAASEVRGTYEGLPLLDRAEQHAVHAREPDLELARTAAIRAEMHLDAAALAKAEAEALRAVALGARYRAIERQATRTLADVHLSRGDLGRARTLCTSILSTADADAEPWISLAARTLLARLALEEGGYAEATSAARAVVAESRRLAEDRIGLLAQILLRHLDPAHRDDTPDPESLPWAIRLPLQTQVARELLADSEFERAADCAADAVVLADAYRLGRDAVEARLALGHSLHAQGDRRQAAATLLTALTLAAEAPLALRAADALDGLAAILAEERDGAAPRLAATAAALRRSRSAVAWEFSARAPAVTPAGRVPARWIVGGQLSEAGLRGVRAACRGETPAGAEAERADGPLDLLTRTERQVADLVADGLISRRIAERLFVSPRTVDAHLTHIYRKLDIGSRARLAALVSEQRRRGSQRAE